MAPVARVGINVEPGRDVQQLLWRRGVRRTLDDGTHYLPLKGDDDYCVISDRRNGGAYLAVASTEDDNVAAWDGTEATPPGTRRRWR